MTSGQLAPGWHSWLCRAMQDGFRPFSPYAFCCRPLRVPSTNDRRFLRAAYQESAPNAPKPCSNEGCKYACIITSSIRPVCPAAFRTDATRAKDLVPCTCDRDQTHTDTSGSSSTIVLLHYLSVFVAAVQPVLLEEVLQRPEHFQSA